MVRAAVETAATTPKGKAAAATIAIVTEIAEDATQGTISARTNATRRNQTEHPARFQAIADQARVAGATAAGAKGGAAAATTATAAAHVRAAIPATFSPRAAARRKSPMELHALLQASADQARVAGVTAAGAKGGAAAATTATAAAHVRAAIPATFSPRAAARRKSPMELHALLQPSADQARAAGVTAAGAKVEAAAATTATVPVTVVGAMPRTFCYRTLAI